MKCVLTEAGDPIQVVQIYPFCMANEDGSIGRMSSFGTPYACLVRGTCGFMVKRNIPYGGEN